MLKEIKEEEKLKTNSLSPVSDDLRNKIRSESAIAGAMKISKKTAKEGFEWGNFHEVWEKVIEELQELKEAIDSKEKSNIQAELGDLFFILVNVARWHQLNPEECIQETNHKFLDRFSLLEKKSTKKISQQSIVKLNELWQSAKNQLDIKKSPDLIEN